MIIGVLKESNGDPRVSLVPENIKALTALNVNILLEKNAGKEAFFDDAEYSESGVSILPRTQILKESDIILTLNGVDINSLNDFKKEKILVGAFNPLSSKEYVMALKESGITSFSLDIIPRTTRAQNMDVLSSMATIAGYKAILESAFHLPRFFPMFMSAAGTIRPAKVLVLGAGVAGLQSIAVARKLGAVVEVFDVRSAVKEEVQSLGGKFIEVEGAVEDQKAGGYAVEQTDAFRALQAKMIHDHATKSNVVICTAQIPGKPAPLLIRKETVEAMMPGSIIVDLAASSGGNCEVTVNDKTIEHKRVKVVGQSNYPALMASDSSKMYGTNLINFLKLLINKEGQINLDFNDDIIKNTCVSHQGEVISERLKKILNI